MEAESLMKIRTGIEVSGKSDIGCLRTNNEDAFGYWEPEDDVKFGRLGRLAIVADGMGGYEGGQEASRIAVDTMVEKYGTYAGNDPQQALIEGLQAAHEEIRRYGVVHPDLQGMGTTCTAIAIVQDAMHYVHVGDTRLYLIRDGKITQVTRDHSYVGRLVEAGMITREEAEHHPQRNILTSALGTSPELVMDAPGRPEPLRQKDVLVICSDGLWGQVQDQEILETVNKQAADGAGRDLIELARQRGGPDNITVSILRMQ